MAQPAPSASQTREQILEAAERVFAVQGYEASSIKDLAAAARVNSALLYYYYGDKERLYRAVLERIVRRVERRALARLKRLGTPEERLRRFILTHTELLMRERHLWPLVLRELVDHAAVHAVDQIRLMAATLFRTLCEVIEEGQATGHFRAELDPRFAAISTISLVAHFFTARPVIGVFLGGGTDDPPPAIIRAYAVHAADYALGALR